MPLMIPILVAVVVAFFEVAAWLLKLFMLIGQSTDPFQFLTSVMLAIDVWYSSI